MFQIPLIMMEIPDWVNKKQKLLDLYGKYSLEDYDNSYKGYEVETNFHYLDENKEEKNKFCAEVSLILEEEFFIFKREINNFDVYLDIAWCQLYKKNQEHAIHNHGALGYSFVCYIEFNPEFHKPTTFISPFNNFGNGTTLYHTPNAREGNIIFFPSVILHESTKNFSDEERIILSGNFKIK